MHFPDNKTKLNEYSTKYINDFETVENLTKADTENFDYENPKAVFENLPLKNEDKNIIDPQNEDIFPNPFSLLNKTKSNHDENVIKICE